jgi:serine/threonine protein kinase
MNQIMDTDYCIAWTTSRTKPLVDRTHKFIKDNFLDNIKDNFLDNTNKIISFGICAVFLLLFLGSVLYHIFNLIGLMISVKLMIWLIEEYNPTSSANTKNNFANNVMEYQTGFFLASTSVWLINLMAMPLKTITNLFPFLPIDLFDLMYFMILIASFCLMVSQEYRQSLCMYVKDLLSNGRFHKFLRSVDHLINLTNQSLNMLFRPKTLHQKILDCKNLGEFLSNPNDRPTKKTNDTNETEDQLDEDM